MSNIRALGHFQVESSELIVSDPCYVGNFGKHNVIRNVKNGTWLATAFVGEDDCVKMLSTFHVAGMPVEHSLASFVVYVDSGQAGIFDAAHYGNDDDVSKDETFPNVFFRDSEEYSAWYKMCCDRTLGKESGGVIPFGVLTSSGYGDGGYDCYYFKDHKGEIVGVSIGFIGGEEDDDDEYEE